MPKETKLAFYQADADAAAAAKVVAQDKLKTLLTENIVTVLNDRVADEGDKSFLREVMFQLVNDVELTQPQKRLLRKLLVEKYKNSSIEKYDLDEALALTGYTAPAATAEQKATKEIIAAVDAAIEGLDVAKRNGARSIMDLSITELKDLQNAKDIVPQTIDAKLDQLKEHGIDLVKLIAKTLEENGVDVNDTKIRTQLLAVFAKQELSDKDSRISDITESYRLYSPIKKEQTIAVKKLHDLLQTNPELKAKLIDQIAAQGYSQDTLDKLRQFALAAAIGKPEILEDLLALDPNSKAYTKQLSKLAEYLSSIANTTPLSGFNRLDSNGKAITKVTSYKLAEESISTLLEGVSILQDEEGEGADLKLHDPGFNLLKLLTMFSLPPKDDGELYTANELVDFMKKEGIISFNKESKKYDFNKKELQESLNTEVNKFLQGTYTKAISKPSLYSKQRLKDNKTIVSLLIEIFGAEALEQQKDGNNPVYETVSKEEIIDSIAKFLVEASKFYEEQEHKIPKAKSDDTDNMSAGLYRQSTVFSLGII
ncbi:MAG: hypothetical protein HOA17_01930 [Candidatus Melainabacteria bacterium]|nr:hypothetical protein [Candidatus Melainabacteria bacterium]